MMIPYKKSVLMSALVLEEVVVTAQKREEGIGRADLHHCPE